MVVPVPDGNHFEGITVSCDVLQGSVLGLALCNVYYDGLMRLSFLDGVQLIGSTDNIALIITKQITEEIECFGSCDKMDGVSQVEFSGKQNGGDND